MTRTATRAVSTDLLPHLRRARDHMNRHYDQPLDLDQLASVAGVSKFHFVRSFEATYADTPIRYLSRRRIERAQDLLRHANLTVTEVCMLVGVVLVEVRPDRGGEPDRLPGQVGCAAARRRRGTATARRPTSARASSKRWAQVT